MALRHCRANALRNVLVRRAYLLVRRAYLLLEEPVVLAGMLDKHLFSKIISQVENTLSLKQPFTITFSSHSVSVQGPDTHRLRYVTVLITNAVSYLNRF